MRRKRSKSQTQERNEVHPLPHAAVLELSEWDPPVLAMVDVLNQSVDSKANGIQRDPQGHFQAKRRNSFTDTYVG